MSDEGRLGPVSVWSLTAGGMVGGGIYTVLGVVIAVAAQWAWLSFVIAGVAALSTAWAYATLANEFEESGASGSVPGKAVCVLGATAALLAITGSLSTLVEAASLAFLFTFGAVDWIAWKRAETNRWIPLAGLGVVAVIGVALLVGPLLAAPAPVPAEPARAGGAETCRLRLANLAVDLSTLRFELDRDPARSGDVPVVAELARNEAGGYLGLPPARYQAGLTSGGEPVDLPPGRHLVEVRHAGAREPMVRRWLDAEPGRVYNLYLVPAPPAGAEPGTAIGVVVLSNPVRAARRALR